MALLALVACPPGGGGGSGAGGTAGTGTSTGSATTATGATASTGTATGGTGDPCAADFGPGWAETPDGECACAPGLVLCGTECVDLRSDPAHCGTCNTSCAGGADCVLGRCGGIFPAPGVGPVRLVSGGAPQTVCSWATEAVPERSVNAAPGQPDYVVAYQLVRPGIPGADAYYNWTLPSGDWDPDLHLAPDPPGEDARVDPWATTHGGTRTDYFSYQGPSLSNLIVGGSTPAELQGSGSWTVPPRVVISGNVDGPSFLADLGAPALYAAWEQTIGETTSALLQRFAPCTGPDPGGMDCPAAWPAPSQVFPSLGDSLRAHVDLAINPCTHRPIVSARTSIGSEDKGRIQYRVVSLAGQVGPERDADTIPAIPLPVCSSASVGEIPRCVPAQGDCGPANTCLDVNPRPHSATLLRKNPDTGEDQCLLYLAYDIVDGETSSVRLKVFDVTDPNLSADQAHLETFDVPKDDPADLDFQGTVAVDRFTGAVGVFFYRQEGGAPCTTSFRGMVRRPGEPFEAVEVSDGTFPSTTFDPATGGLGHYIRAARFTKPGVLFPTWSQPVPTTDPACDTCQGVRYSQAILGAEVVP